MNFVHKGYPDGLTTQQVELSRKQSGNNALTAKKRTGFGKKYLASLGDPIIKILLAALAVNLLFLFRGEGWFETVGIAVAVFLASFLSTLSEYGSESAFLRLQEEASKTTCRVRRGGETLLLPSDQLVCGDIVLLGAGEGVPADGILLSGKLSVDQAALNGESREVEKRPTSQEEDSNRWELSNSHMLFRGTVIAAGEGVVVVKRVGDATFFGSMAQSLQEETRESPLKLRLGKLAQSISRIGYIAAILIAFADLFNRIVMDNGFILSAMVNEVADMGAMVENLLHAATLAISIVIVAVPEGLPMMITVVLSSSMFRMLKDKVMVRKLTGIETAGSINILFTDKTGTLTYGKLAVESILDGEGTLYRDKGALMRHPALANLIALSGNLNTSATLSGKKAAGGNATDRAILSFVSALPRADGYRRTAFRPFDSVKKFSAATAVGEKTYHLVKGAPEMLLARCRSVVGTDGGIRPFTGRTKIMSQCQEASRRGERVVCLCMADGEVGETLPESLTFLCLCLIRDGLRKEARGVVEGIHNAGVQVVMITGDAKETATAIAREAGLLDISHPEILSSSELAQMTDHDIASLLPRLRVVARALPTDKSRLVRIAQREGLVAAMTGDGVNDAPALRLADVGFAMGSGTQVAKDAGDVVILDDNIASISQAILYGRTIFKSIQKFLIFQLTMNMAAVGISLIGPFIGIDVPVTVMQMLWINIIMDTLAGLAFAGEPPLKEYMKEPPKKREAPVLTPVMSRQIAATGAYMIAICIAFLLLPFVWQIFDYEESTLLTGFFALFVFSGIFSAFCARSDRINHFANIGRNRVFVGIIAIIFTVQLTMIYFGGTLFRTGGLNRGQLFFVLALSATVIPIDIGRKLLVRRMNRPAPIVTPSPVVVNVPSSLQT